MHEMRRVRSRLDRRSIENVVPCSPGRRGLVGVSRDSERVPEVREDRLSRGGPSAFCVFGRRISQGWNFSSRMAWPLRMSGKIRPKLDKGRNV